MSKKNQINLWNLALVTENLPGVGYLKIGLFETRREFLETVEKEMRNRARLKNTVFVLIIGVMLAFFCQGYFFGNFSRGIGTVMVILWLIIRSFSLAVAVNNLRILTTIKVLNLIFADLDIDPKEKNSAVEFNDALLRAKDSHTKHRRHLSKKEKILVGKNLPHMVSTIANNTRPEVIVETDGRMTRGGGNPITTVTA